MVCEEHLAFHFINDYMNCAFEQYFNNWVHSYQKKNPYQFHKQCLISIWVVPPFPFHWLHLKSHTPCVGTFFE